MATTTNLGLIQPTVGGDTDAWGGYLNSDLGYIDALFGITSTSVTLHVNNQNIASSSYKFDQIKMGDNRSLQFGAGASLAAPDYWLVYNSSGTQLELHSTNVDGSGTDGTVLKVADGTDDVSFTGQIQGASGVVAATAISVGGDTTSGFYRGGTNIVNISNAGALTASFGATNISTIQKLSVAGDGATVTGIKDEDNMSSNSATKLATQQSIKAYVDAQVGSFDTLAEVLAAGNTTGSTDIVVTSGQKITTNTISETTGASGVTIDGVLVKDSTVTASGGFAGNATTASSSPAGALTGTTLKSAVVASSLTSVGTIGTGVWNGTAVAPGFGGTGLSSYSAGDILYATGSSTLAKLAKGSDTQVLTLASGLPSWVAPTVGDITGITAGTGLSGTDLTGPVPTLNVDASQTQITAVGTIGTGVWNGTPVATAYIADNAVTLAKLEHGTQGDILYYGASGTPARLGTGSDGQVLTSGGSGANPAWETATVGDITKVTAGAGMTGGGDSGDVTLNVIGTTNKITVSSDAVTIASGYVGQGSITTLGTITSGVWNGTAITGDYIDPTSSPLANTKVWIGDSNGDAREFALSGDATMTAGGAVTVVAAPAGTLTGSTLKSSVTASSLTSVGTIGTGTWQGTKVASAYLDDDTAHLSGTQTFSGAKTFSAALTASSTLGVTGKLTQGSGSHTVSADADDLVVNVASGNGGITIATADAGIGSIYFANASDSIAARLRYDGPSGSGVFSVGSANAGDVLLLQAGNQTTFLTGSGANATFAGTLGVTGTSTLTGDATVGNGAGQPSMNLNGAAGGIRDLRFQTGGSLRWAVRADEIAETGSDAGSNFQIIARNDAGGNLGSALTITRASKAVSLSGALTVTGATTLTGAVLNIGVSGVSNAVINAPEAMYFNIDSDGSQTDRAFHWSTNKADDGGGGTELMRLTEAGQALINDATVNSKMTIGLTINQGASDDEILAFKSSKVNQPSTSYTEADTYGFVTKAAAEYGGLKFGAFTESGGDSKTCYYQVVNADDANATKSTSGRGLYQIDLALNDGTSSKVVNADGNMVAFTSNGNARFLFQADGTGYADVAWTTFSDSRLKTDVAAIPYGLASVRSVEAKIFDKWSGEIDAAGDVILEDGSDSRMIGFIAQDVKAAMPELVPDLQDDKSFYSLDYGRMTPVLWSAMQELDAEVQTLKARIAALEA